jgi:hypothetical protein
VESTICGMRSRDLPPNRSLADNYDQSGAADGRARSPAELLDNLRLRLSQLPENHPSAMPESMQERDSEREWPAGNDSLRDERRPDAPEPQDDGPIAGGGTLGDLIRAIRDTGDSLAGSIGDGMLGDLGAFPGGIPSEPYRPWFMSGDPGVPWFAADDIH